MNAKEFVKKVKESKPNSCIIWDEREPPIYDYKSFLALQIEKEYYKIRRLRDKQ
jgi:hypothetical protein